MKNSKFYDIVAKTSDVPLWVLMSRKVLPRHKWSEAPLDFSRQMSVSEINATLQK
jgi:hypothetical protein